MILFKMRGREEVAVTCWSKNHQNRCEGERRTQTQAKVPERSLSVRM